MFIVQNGGMKLGKSTDKKFKNSFNESKTKKSKIIVKPGGDD